jgi:Uncharacterised nucleotidyltransferase
LARQQACLCPCSQQCCRCRGFDRRHRLRRWQAFNAVCGHLRAGLLDHTPPDQDRQVSWEALIAASSHHYVTPALAWCSQQDHNVPIDVRGYLDAVLRLNAKRNELLLDALHRVVAVLNAIDIEPVLLKGAARLIEGIYPAPGLRVLGDLDLLIPKDQAEDAALALGNIGFTVSGPVPENHHHLPVLCDPETGAGVELHTGAVHRRSEAIMPSTRFFEKTRVLALQGSRVRLLDATQSIGHNVVHDQLDHEGYLRKRVELRQLLDLVVMRARHESAIDWAELDRRFSGAHLGHVLATYLRFAEEFFGQSAPRLSHAPRADAITELRRLIDPGMRRWAYLAEIAADYIAARRQDPSGVLNLLKPETWHRRIRLISNGAKRKW